MVCSTLCPRLAFIINAAFAILYGKNMEIRTARLILRDWKDEDIALFAEINQDPKVMEHFPGFRNLKETHDMVSALRKQLKESGFTFWAVELISSGEFIGLIGLSQVTFDLPFGPAVEIGWRLS